MRLEITLIALLSMMAMVLAYQLPRSNPDAPVKGGHPIVNKALPARRPHIPIPTKGTYNCGQYGELLCRLQPGVEPPNCNGICQYPVA